MFRVNILSESAGSTEKTECSKEIGHGVPQPDIRYEMPKLTSHLLMGWSVGFKELGQRYKAV